MYLQVYTHTFIYTYLNMPGKVDLELQTITCSPARSMKTLRHLQSVAPGLGCDTDIYGYLRKIDSTIWDLIQWFQIQNTYHTNPSRWETCSIGVIEATIIIGWVFQMGSGHLIFSTKYEPVYLWVLYLQIACMFSRIASRGSMAILSEVFDWVSFFCCKRYSPTKPHR